MTVGSLWRGVSQHWDQKTDLAHHRLCPQLEGHQGSFAVVTGCLQLFHITMKNEKQKE